MSEQISGDMPEHEGEKYLTMLGLGHFAEEPIRTPGGEIPAKDFLDICGDHARPMLKVYESMPLDDPRRVATETVLKKVIMGYIDPKDS